MHTAYHHIVKKKKQKKKGKARFGLQLLMDKSVYIFTFFGICANIPQLNKIWIDRNIGGVSIITWIGFLFGSSFWLMYGIIHKEKPIVIANSFFVTIQFLIVLGLLLQHAQFTIL